jgi:polyisoprenyl-phosphate glycosyltransferase
MANKLLLVVPCYNEEEILSKSNEQITAALNSWITEGLLSPDSRVCYVNDGSKDATWSIIEIIARAEKLVLGLKLSKNFGHQNAVLAGHFNFKNDFDIFISLDADLQDDILVVKEMVQKYNAGNEIVYGVRDDRSNDSFFKRFTAEFFYKIMLKMGIPLVFNHADYRLMSKKVVAELDNYKEFNMFLRGIVPTLGFTSDKVYYKRLKREAGESKYPIRKMISFAWNGITSFSNHPMRMVLWFGIFNFILAVLIGIYVLISMFKGQTVAGWVSIVLPMAYFSGATMVAIGLMGEYLGKIYEEVKARPRYIIEKTIGQ